MSFIFNLPYDFIGYSSGQVESRVDDVLAEVEETFDGSLQKPLSPGVPGKLDWGVKCPGNPP